MPHAGLALVAQDLTDGNENIINENGRNIDRVFKSASRDLFC